MNIQIDTLNKADTLGKFFPKNEWKEYKLETNTVINWTNPYIISPYYPYNYPWITYTTGSDYTISTGTYNISVS